MSEFQVVKFKHAKVLFEVLCKPGEAMKYRKTPGMSIDNVLLSDDVFKNYQTGEKPTNAELAEAFKTSDVKECAKQILEKGEIQLSTAERKEMAENKLKEIIHHIHRNFVDPKTKLPHPVMRIENALAQIKFHAAWDIATHVQIDDVVKKLPDVLPIRKMEFECELMVPHAFVGQANGVIPKWGKILKEDYDGKGANFLLSTLPGDFEHLVADLQRITKGDFRLDVVGGAAAAPTTGASESGGGKGKGGKGGGGKGKGK